MFSLEFNINFIKDKRQWEEKASTSSLTKQRFHVFLINKMKTINQNLLRLSPFLLFDKEVCSSIL